MDVSLALAVLAGVALALAIALGVYAFRRRPARKGSAIAAGVLAALAIVGFALSILTIQTPRAPISGAVSLYYVRNHSGNLTLEAASAATGAVRWSYTTRSAEMTPDLAPLLDHGIFYLANFTVGDATTSEIRALRASDGKQLWATTITGNIWRVGGASQEMLATADDVVYGATTGGVFALRASDGQRLWNTPLSGGPTSPVRVMDGLVYVAGTTAEINPSQRTTTIYAFDAKTGGARWKYQTQAQNLNRIALTSSAVYAASDTSSIGQSDLYALNAANGTVRWQGQLRYGAYTLTATPGALYVNSQAGLAAFDAATGASLWHISQSPMDDLAPVVVAGVVYLTVLDLNATGSAGVMQALDARYGKKLWQTTLDTNAAYVTVDNETIYVGGSSAYALQASDGHILWSYGGKGQFYQPVVSDGVVFIGSSDPANTLISNPFDNQNFLNALDARTGKLYWRTSGSVENAPLVAS